MTVRRPDASPPFAALAVAVLTASVLAVLAWNNGAFDVVTRQSAGLLAWWGAGLVALVIPRGRLTPRASGIAVTAFGLAIPLWITFTLGDSISAERTGNELARTAAHLAPIVLIGWLMPARHWRNVLYGATLGGVAIVLVGFADRLSPGLVDATRTVVFPNTADRLATPLGYWNAVGSWSAITLVLLLAVASHERHPAVRAAALAVAPITIAVAYVTYSRSAIVSALVALVVLLVLSRNRWTLAAHGIVVAAGGAALVAAIHGKPEIANATGGAGASDVVFLALIAAAAGATVGAGTARLQIDDRRLSPRLGRGLGLATAAVAAIALVGAGISQGPELRDKFVEGSAQKVGASRLTDVGNGPRVKQWRATLDTWREHRGTGTGAGTFEFDWNLSTRNDTSFVRDAHSVFLETLAEQGTPGFLILCGFMLSIGAAVVTARRRAVRTRDIGLVAGAGAGIAAFVVGSAFDWFWEVTALAVFMLVLLGALIAAGREEPADEPAAADVEPRRALPWRLAIAAVCAIGALVQVPGLVGTSEVRRSQQAIAAGDIGEARARADRAIDTMPWASSPFLQRALVDEQAGAFDAASSALELAMKRDPYDWRLPLVLSRVEAKAGHVNRALAAYRKARSLRPSGQFFTRTVSPSGSGA